MKKKYLWLHYVMILVFGFISGFIVRCKMEFIEMNVEQYFATGKNILLVNGNWESNFYFSMHDGTNSVSFANTSKILIKDIGSEKDLYFIDGYQYEFDKTTDSKTKSVSTETELQKYYDMVNVLKAEVLFIVQNNDLFEMKGYMFEKSYPIVELLVDKNNCEKIDFLDQECSLKILMSFNGSNFKLDYMKNTETNNSGYMFSFFRSDDIDFLLPKDLDEWGK